ncbi:MAG TPA: ABC transporter permease [Thermoanaerobaculaceae bacterium]|nr:ABC transporter permease [Thermoanaerobaculaceae bacterium]
MLRWRKLATVLRREYLSRVRTRAFWISTLAVPLLVAAFSLLPSLLLTTTGGRYTVALVTGDKPLAADLQRILSAREAQDTGLTGKLDITLQPVAPAADAAGQRTELKRRVLAKELSAVVVLPAGILDGGSPEYVSTNVSSFRVMNRIERGIAAAVIHQRLTREGFPAAKVDAITKPVVMEAVRIAPDLSESRKAASEKSFVLSYVLSFLLYMTMIFYGYYVMRGVLEEKSSRVVEVVVANLRPTELMFGKIFGIGAVGLTQYAIWVLALLNLTVIGSLFGSSLTEGRAAYVSPSLMVFFVVFFVLGYFQYAACYAALGAAFNTEEEAQQMQTVISMVLALSFVLMFPVMANPDAPVSVVLSLIPIFSPVLFFMRMTIQSPPLWQTVLCLALLVGSVLTLARFAAAVYRVGILMYGKKPTLREILQWARTP